MPRLAQDTARLQPTIATVPTPLEAAAVSNAASANAAIADAVTGDLIAANPELAAKLAEFESRIKALEP